MQFFTSPEDLKSWVQSQKSADSASLNIMEVIGKNSEKDIVDTCRSIFSKTGNSDHAAKILFDVLSQYDITQIREGKMKDKLVKQAQAVMRQDALYSNLDMRICPKLPKQSAGHGLISTYNCRHYCLDSLVFDDDPNRVYCSEALWRRHIMDKFSREFKDKEGKWVGGYINQRFQVFRDDGGNQMELAHGERTRKPRPHQFSTERRLSEGRGEETYDLTASSENKFVKVASVISVDSKEENDIYKMFDDIIEMKQSGMNEEDIICKVSEHYNVSIPKASQVHKLANIMLERHNRIAYAHTFSKISSKTSSEQYPLFDSLSPELKRKALLQWSGELDAMEKKYAGNKEQLIRDITIASSKKKIKISQMDLPEKSTLVTKKDMEIKVVENGKETILKIETPVVMISNGSNPVFHITGGPSAGVNFTLKNANDVVDGFGIEDEGEDQIQEAADELGLNESLPSVQNAEPPAQNK